MTVATAGRAVFFSGLTVLLGLLGLVLFEFMILRSVGIAGAIVVGLAVASALTLLPAILTVLGPGWTAWRAPRVADGRRRTARGRGWRGGSCATRSRCSSRPLRFLLVLGSPFLHVRFNAPDATILPPEVPSRAAFDRLQAEFGEGEFAPIVLAIRTDGAATSPANLAALYDYSRRLAPGSAGRPRRQPGRRRSAPDARPVHAAVWRPERPARPLHPDGPGGDDQGRPDGVHAVHAVRAEPRRGPGARGGPPTGRAARSRRRPG